MLAMVDRPVSTEETALRHSPIAALERALEELASVVAALSPEAYGARLFPNASGSIGEHVRHCLDHVSALVSADPSSCLSYDRRERGTAVETDPVQALRCIQLLRIKVAGRPMVHAARRAHLRDVHGRARRRHAVRDVDAGARVGVRAEPHHPSPGHDRPSCHAPRVRRAGRLRVRAVDAAALGGARSMCTVSIVPIADGCRVVCNRDERRTRAAARPPRTWPTEVSWATYPRIR